jgi:CubicO group peptidase (beta-lactamase class C family)
VKDGSLVYEEYFSGLDRRWRGGQQETVTVSFERDTLHDIRSIGKSITSALVGIAIGTGTIPSLDAPLVDFFAEHAPLVTPEKRRITLRHALTMSAGLSWNENDVSYTDTTNHSEQMYASPDPVGWRCTRRWEMVSSASLLFRRSRWSSCNWRVATTIRMPIGSRSDCF